jgi:hypothetical protein
MIVVFWLEHAHPEGVRTAHHAFAPDDLSGALRHAEALRARRAAGEAISHVCIQSELEHAVGPAGVADAPGDYAHYKRRIDPAIRLGRERTPESPGSPPARG